MYFTVCSLRRRGLIAQWENECISLSVLSVAQVMIAQWKNECISLSVLSETRGLIAQWENEYISMSVLSHGLGSIHDRDRVFQKIILGRSHALSYIRVWEDQRFGPQLKQ